MAESKEKPQEDDRDPYADLWPELMADPEIGIPGSWWVKYHGRAKGYEIFVAQYPGYQASKSPIPYTPAIYKKNLERLFRRLASALERYEQTIDGQSERGAS